MPARTVTTMRRVKRGTTARADRDASIVVRPRSAAFTVPNVIAPSRAPSALRKCAITTAWSSLARKPPSSADSRITAPERASISGAQRDTSTTWRRLAGPPGPAAKNAWPARSVAAASSVGNANTPATVP